MKELTMVMVVGPPASGKSTWAEKYAKENNLVYISTDQIRKEIGKGEDDQSVSPAAFLIGRKRASEALSVGKSVMIDATNINRKFRKEWTKIGRDHKAKIIAVAFEVDKDTLIKRDAQRDRHVGEEIIDRFLQMYSRPDETEVDQVIVNPK